MEDIDTSTCVHRVHKTVEILNAGLVKHKNMNRFKYIEGVLYQKSLSHKV